MSVPAAFNEDAVIACYELAGRGGAIDFKIGYLYDNVPSEEACWFAEARWRGHRKFADKHSSPSNAANALAEKLLAGADCKCGQTVTLNDTQPGCRWTLQGKRWEAGCTAPPLDIPPGQRGNLAALDSAVDQRRTEIQAANRAARRAAKRQGRRP